MVFIDMVCWLGLLHTIFTSLCISILGLCMLYRNFYCIFSFESLQKRWGSGNYIAIVVLMWGYPVIEISSF
jgi:hypothetical protein